MITRSTRRACAAVCQPRPDAGRGRGRLALILAAALLAGCASGKAGGVCGNEIIEAGEECDGLNLGGLTCESLGLARGTLICAGCRFISLGCNGAGLCDDGNLDPGEACDGQNLGGESCQSRGFDGGLLQCGPGCTGFDTTLCTLASCGNGQIDAGEECDDGDSSSGDGCGQNCQIEPGYTCFGTPSTCSSDCGNGTIDVGEECETGNLQGETCTSLNQGTGTLACGADCQFDISACTGGTCGNGTIDTATGEECDSGQLGAGTCENQGFATGTLACDNTSCRYDTAGCTTCGDDVADAGDLCDGPDLKSESCISQGFPSGGTLACYPNCTFDTSQCITVCGNGVIEGNEECDDGGTADGDGCGASCRWEQTCSGAQPVACNATTPGNIPLLPPAPDSANYYACSTRAATNIDGIFSFTAPRSGQATVTLGGFGGLFSDDFDLYVLEGACNPDLCVGAGENDGSDTVNFSVSAGLTYYLLVEWDEVGFPPSGNFDLTVTCP